MAEFEKMDLGSADLVADRIDLLRELLPEAFAESGIDFEKLRLLLGDEVDEGTERYAFTWPGKADAIRQSQTPSTATLRPAPEDSVDWDETHNLYIEGDNLEVLKLLQHSYHGRVKMIYIDPPYNTGHDFVYKDCFEESVENYRQQVNATAQSNSDSQGRFHSNWCSMIYPRIKLARELLREDGVLFVSIGDNEVDNLKKICNEVFGESNFIGCAGRISKKANNQGDYWAPNFDYLLTYTKDINCCEKFFGGMNESSYNLVDDDGPRKGERYQLVRLYMTSLDPMRGCTNQRYYIECPDGSFIIPPGNTYPSIVSDASHVVPQSGADKVWRWSYQSYLEKKDQIVIKQGRSSNVVGVNGEPTLWNAFTKTYLNDVISKKSSSPNSFIEDHINQKATTELRELGIPFDFAKPSSLIKYLAEVCQVSEDDIVLDFFSGSSSTAHAVMLANAEDGARRRFIMVQLPEPTYAVEFERNSTANNNRETDAYRAGYQTICELGEERIRRAGAKIAAEIEESNKQLRLGEEPRKVPDIGFRVFKLDESGIERPKPGELLPDVVKEDRTDLDIVFEMMLKWGLELTLPIEKVDAAGYPCYSVACGELVCCLEQGLDMKVLDAIADMEPRRVLMLDRILDDTTKLNAVQAFKRVEERTGREVELRTV